MSENAINIGWNKYESVLLIDSYQKYINGKMERKEAVALLSKRLRAKWLNSGYSLNDKFRNENGISLQMSAIEYLFTDGQKGLPNASELFKEMVITYKENRSTFCTFLNIANYIYPKVSVTKIEQQEHFDAEQDDNSPINSAAEETNTEHEANISSVQEDHDSQSKYEENSSSVNESLNEWYANGKIKQVIREKFPRGYRLSSYMEARRMRVFYLDIHGENLNLDDDKIDDIVKECGIEHGGRVYLPEQMLSDELRNELESYIRDSFKQGTQCLYYSVLYDKFHERFLDFQILSPMMLKSYLEYNNTDGWWFGEDYLAEKQNSGPDILQEVEDYVKMQGGILFREDVVKGLPQFPPQEVERAFNISSHLVSSGRNQRFHIDNFVASDEELKTIRKIIEKSIEQYRYISFGELLADMKMQTKGLVDNNESFTEIGIRNAIAVKLSNYFNFSGNLISSLSNPVCTEDAFWGLGQKEEFTIDEVMALATDCSTLPNLWIGYLFDFSIRLNKKDFVSKNKVSFDIDATDEALSKLCPKQYIALHDIKLFSVFPDCGYPWNVFLLECYVACYSKLFMLFHGSYYGTRKAIGGIVRRKSGIQDFSDLIVQVIYDCDISLDRNTALEYLFEKGYIAQRRYEEIDIILKRVTILKEKK